MAQELRQTNSEIFVNSPGFLHESQFIATIGDICTVKLIQEEIIPNLMIVDYKTKRNVKLTEEQMSDAENSFMQALDELQDNLTSEDNSRPLDSDEKIPTNPSNKSEDDGEGDMNNTPLSEKVFATKSKRSGDTDANKVGTEENQ